MDKKSELLWITIQFKKINISYYYIVKYIFYYDILFKYICYKYMYITLLGTYNKPMLFL